MKKNQKMVVCPKTKIYFRLSYIFFLFFPLSQGVSVLSIQSLVKENLSNNGLGLLLGLGALTETVLEATVNIGQVAHATGTGGLSADALDAPVVCERIRNRRLHVSLLVQQKKKVVKIKVEQSRYARGESQRPESFEKWFSVPGYLLMHIVIQRNPVPKSESLPR